MLLDAVGIQDSANIALSLLHSDHHCLWCFYTKAHFTTPLFVTCGSCGIASYCSNDHLEDAKVAHTIVQSEIGLSEVRCLLFF